MLGGRKIWICSTNLLDCAATFENVTSAVRFFFWTRQNGGAHRCDLSPIHVFLKKARCCELAINLNSKQPFGKPSTAMMEALKSFLSLGSTPRFIPSLMDRKLNRSDFRAFLRDERHRFDHFLNQELIPFQKTWRERLGMLLSDDEGETLNVLTAAANGPKVCHMSILDAEVYVAEGGPLQSCTVYLYCSRKKMLQILCARRLAQVGEEACVTTIHPFRDDLQVCDMVDIYRAVFTNVDVEEDDFECFVALPLSSGFQAVSREGLRYRFWRRGDGGDKEYEIITAGDTIFAQLIPNDRKRARLRSDDEGKFEDKNIILSA